MLLTPVQLLVSVGDDVVMGSRKPFGTPLPPHPATTADTTSSSPVTLQFLGSVKQNRGAFSHFHKANIGTICCHHRGAKVTLGDALTLNGDGNERTVDEPVSLFRPNFIVFSKHKH